jgi:hypothetical protein
MLSAMDGLTAATERALSKDDIATPPCLPYNQSKGF